MKVQESRFRVRYPEVDQMGIVHHSNYPVWFEIGRTDLLREAGMRYADMEKEGYRLVVVHLQCKYLKPLKYDDPVLIRTRAKEIKKLKISFQYEVIQEETGELCGTGETILGSIDPAGKPKLLPEALVKNLTSSRA